MSCTSQTLQVEALSSLMKECGEDGRWAYVLGGAVGWWRDVWVPSWLASIPVSLYSSDLGAAAREKERADAGTPGERLALTAQQRRIMPGALSSSTNSNVMYGFNCAKEDQRNI